MLATQNPIEQEGTYSLPEAQLDRFMFKILVGYPSEEEELRIISLTTSGGETPLQRIFNSDDILAIQDIVRRVPCGDHVMRYAMRLARSSRPQEPGTPQFIRDYVSWGAGPRASQYLVIAAKARAILHGRFHVTVEDITSVAHPVLRHRLVTNFNAEADAVATDDLVARLIRETPKDATPALDAVGADRVLNRS